MAILEKLKELIPWRKKDQTAQELAPVAEGSGWPVDTLWPSAFEAPWAMPRGWWPDLRAEDDGEKVTVRANVPGLDPKDVHVTIREGLLEIHGEQKRERKHGGRVERRWGAFSRSVTLPSGLDTAAATAECRHGVLTVRIPYARGFTRKVTRIPIFG